MCGQSCLPKGAQYALPSTYTHSTDREHFGFRARRADRGLTQDRKIYSKNSNTRCLMESEIKLVWRIRLAQRNHELTPVQNRTQSLAPVPVNRPVTERFMTPIQVDRKALKMI
ncbi:hypothetical protein AVEN_211972-1 [Araneus ventricosus]|uniref:Uncharacterized protein n=1 Tax=Araneus ventricosus TaxID=182803 RepID=A0A4Y2FZR8_ARAVE|nr:hypothetical protein AVEN_211972-1 [Araneus ventricosus]